MEHLGLHAAAHVFFENKLDDLTSEFNGKIKKVQAFVQKELRKLHDIHMGEVKKLKHEVRGKHIYYKIRHSMVEMSTQSTFFVAKKALVC